MESYPSGQQSMYLKFSANKVKMVRFWAPHKVIVVQPRNLWAFLNHMFSDCLWRVSQSQKCVSSRIIQTYKNWAGSFGAAEQTTQGSGCLCKCYRLVDVTQHVHFLSPRGSLRRFSERLSAGASEPRNMAYMNRLGIWGPKTPFREFGDFIQAVERRYNSFSWCDCLSLSLYIYPPDLKTNKMHVLERLEWSSYVCFYGMFSEVLVPWRLWQWTWN